MTEALAIIGAITGGAGFMLALLTFSRDRAKVVVTHSLWGQSTADGGFDWAISVFIGNHGRQPIAITQAGLRQVRRATLRQRACHDTQTILSAFFMLLNKLGVSEARLLEWSPRILKDAFVHSGGQIWTVLEEPILLGLGELRKYDLPALTGADVVIDKERAIPIHAYAVDSHGRMVVSRLSIDLTDDMFGSDDELTQLGPI
jgi:hypothetical protein